MNEQTGVGQSKCFGTAEETIHKMKRQLIEWESIFPSHRFKNGLMSRIYKEHIQQNKKQRH